MALFTKKTESKKTTADVKTSDIVVANPVAGANFSIIRPRISEKAAKLAQSGKYVFLVKKAANKIEVKKAVEKNYKVHVTQVNIVNNQEKAVNFGRTAGYRSSFKKAIVSLRKGESIEAEK